MVALPPAENWDWLPDLTVAPTSGLAPKRWQLPRGQPQLVYFISAHDDDMIAGPIKIGISDYPALRMAELQACSPTRLVILATCEGGKKRESDYHSRFASTRLHGEWFSRSEPLMRLINWHKVRLSNRRRS